MIILTKKRFQFKSPDGDIFVSAGNMVIENAPNWVEKTTLYEWGLADGDIVEVKGKTSKDEDVAVAEMEGEALGEEIPSIGEVAEVRNTTTREAKTV